VLLSPEGTGIHNNRVSLQMCDVMCVSYMYFHVCLFCSSNIIRIVEEDGMAGNVVCMGRT
jgi:hypothetical protein